MKVQNQGPSRVGRHEKADVARSVSSEERSASPSGGASKGDRVNLSFGREILELTQTAMRQPVEEASISDLRDAIRNGTYRPNLDALQERILTDTTVMDWLLNG